LAHQPEPLSWHQAFRNVEVFALVGRAQLIAGELDAAIDSLRRTADDCSVLVDPIAVTRARLLLGRALERRGDRAEACESYRRVVDAWAASPESRTHREATARSKAVCTP
jgi:hypothetical protein